MISELVQFDGGLSTKTSSHLIGRNEAIVCQNVNLERGTLYPIDSLSYITTTTGRHLYVYNDTLVHNLDPTDDRFYDEYGGRLYWTNNGYSTAGLKRYDSTQTPDPNVGITADAPSPYPQGTAPVTVTASTFDGQLSDAEYTYALTIVDTNGIESVPTIIGSAIATKNKSIKLCVDTALAGTYIPAGHTVKIYRTGGDNPTFNLIVEDMSLSHPSVEIEGSNTCYYDTVADINVSRIELTTFENYTPTQDLDMLVELKGTFFAAFRKRVFFSQTGRPEFWHPLDYVELDKDCTGLGKFGDNVIAFTRTSAYMISGNNRDNVVLNRLPFNQGCINKHSVVNIDAYLVWTSLNGICLFDGSSVQVLTKKTLAWDEFNRLGNAMYQDYDNTTDKWDGGAGFNILYATGYQDKYYGVFNNGIMVLDLSNGLKVSSIYVENIVSVSLNKEDNFLYVVVDNLDNTYDVFATLSSESKMTATWKTGRLTEGTVNVKKHYRRVIIDGMPLSVEVFVDGVSKFYVENRDTFFLPASLTGRDIQFEINTINEIRGLKYEYNMLRA